MKVLWLDLTAGVAGDMLLGALLDAGASLEVVQREVDAVLPGSTAISRDSVRRAGLRAAKARVATLVEDQPVRHWADLRRMITDADLREQVREHALSAFGVLAEAEAKAHDIPVDDVHFHEVGAWDSVADVVGVCSALAELRVTDIVASTVAVGSGRIRAAHGMLPVPVPAVLNLIHGWEVIEGGTGELATPTGVALVTALAARQGGLPPMRVTATGVGAGDRDREDLPNVVRAVLGEVSDADSDESMAVLEANIDDLDPRVWPVVLDELFAAGAVDAWLTPIQMKRGRPALTLHALTSAAAAEQVEEAFFTHTTTLGVRRSSVRRRHLARGFAAVDVLGQDIAVKVSHSRGRIVHATPEFRDVEAAAARLDQPVRAVLSAAISAAHTAGLHPGASAPPGLS